MDDEGKQTYSNQSTVGGSSKVMFSFFQILIFEDDISPPPQQQEMVEKNTILGFRMGWQSRCEGLTG